MQSEIIWTDEYSIHLEEIDVQHKNLCRIVNKCIRKANGYLPDVKTTELVEQLLHYVRWHFQSEESLMREFDFPCYDSHKEEHEKLLQTLQEKVDIIEKEPGKVSTLPDFLFQWFGGHSFGYDKEMGHYFRFLNK